MTQPRSEDLHGSAPDKASQALLLIDVINGMEFPQGDRLLRYAQPAARRIASLKARARAAGVPVIYINDNFGRWRSDFSAQVQHCLQPGVPGRPIAQLLQPDVDDYFVLKPKHSGFYSTSLDVLLRHLGSTTLILTGFAGDQCVHYTANDAYMRSYELIVPRDCIASESKPANDRALEHMKRTLHADIRISARVTLAKVAPSNTHLSVRR